MKKLTMVAAAVAMMFGSSAASADEVARVDDPTPTKQFTGSYDCSYYAYDSEGNATKTERTCKQSGYVAVYDDGIVACNGNEAIKRPDNGDPLQGYVWIGPAHAAGTTTFAAPGGAVGAGNNRAADDATTKDADEAHGPCEDAPPPKG